MQTKLTDEYEKTGNYFYARFVNSTKAECNNARLIDIDIHKLSELIFKNTIQNDSQLLLNSAREAASLMRVTRAQLALPGR